MSPTHNANTMFTVPASLEGLVSDAERAAAQRSVGESYHPHETTIVGAPIETTDLGISQANYAAMRREVDSAYEVKPQSSVEIFRNIGNRLGFARKEHIAESKGVR